MTDEEVLTEEERKKIEYQSQHGICLTCGHERNSHCRMITGLFKGCQECDCKEFKWPDNNE